MKIQSGFDTVCFYHCLSPKQKKAIMKELKVLPKFNTIEYDYENETCKYASDYFTAKGVKLRISRIRGSIWGLYVIVHPALVLGNDDRSTLYQASKSSYNKIVKTVDKMLKSVNIPYSLDDMLIYRMDVTVNLICDDEELADEYIRIMKRSIILPHYKPDRFREDEAKAKDCKLANRHSHKQYCKSAAFFVYDKTAQLAMTDHFPDALIGKKVLRFEAQLRRNALKKWLPKREFGNNWETFRDIYKSRERIIKWYLGRTQPPCGRYLRYEDAVRMVKKSTFRKKSKVRMQYLLRKTSDKESLTSALNALRNKYHLTGGQCKAVLRKFQKLGISPITLKSSSDREELPPICI